MFHITISSPSVGRRTVETTIFPVLNAIQSLHLLTSVTWEETAPAGEAEERIWRPQKVVRITVSEKVDRTEKCSHVFEMEDIRKMEVMMRVCGLSITQGTYELPRNEWTNAIVIGMIKDLRGYIWERDEGIDRS